MTLHEKRWRQRRALIMRSQGMTYRVIAGHLGLSLARAICIVHQGASQVLQPTFRIGQRRLYGNEKLDRALYMLRMRTFNISIYRRHYARNTSEPR